MSPSEILLFSWMQGEQSLAKNEALGNQLPRWMDETQYKALLTRPPSDRTPSGRSTLRSSKSAPPTPTGEGCNSRTAGGSVPGAGYTASSQHFRYKCVYVLALTFTTEHAGYVLLVPFKGGFSRILEEICATNSKFDQKFESLEKDCIHSTGC